MTFSSATDTAAATNPHMQAKNSSFHMAMLLLPKAKRKALLTLYAVCRALDDAVDDAPTPQAAQMALQQWNQELDAVFHYGTPTLSLTRDLQVIHQRYQFNYADMQSMLAALQCDAQERMLCPSLTELEHYCYGVASAVGLMSMQIFGCDNPQARPFAIALGHALQLTNILRDVLTDAALGRVYLPIEVLEAPITPAAILYNPPTIQPACAILAQRAKKYFLEADALATYLPTRAIAPALAMRDVYGLYWHKLQTLHWHSPATGKIPLTTTEKASLVARASSYLLGQFKPVEL